MVGCLRDINFWLGVCETQKFGWVFARSIVWQGVFRDVKFGWVFLIDVKIGWVFARCKTWFGVCEISNLGGLKKNETNERYDGGIEVALFGWNVF